MALSAKRAMSVKNYIVSAGIVESRIQTIACGETSPKVKNNTAKNRQINRRVESTQFITF
jgi:outer membrane protein OmpA-like peptidoglycan-associated protein